MAFDFSDAEPLTEEQLGSMLDAYSEAIARAEESEIEGIIDPLCLCSGELRIHRGDLSVDELHLDAECPTLVVEGDLRVAGTIVQEFRAGFLIVLGNVEAKNIVTTALIFVTGDLSVEDTICGNCTNYSTDVLGKTKARVLISAKEHYFCLYGGHSIDRIVDVYGDTPNLDDRTDGEEALVEEIDSGFDEDAVATRMRAGAPLLVE